MISKQIILFQGVKFIVLKKRGYEGKSDTSSSSEHISDENKNDSKKCRLSDDKESAKNKETSNQSNILHSHSSPSILGMASPQVQNAADLAVVSSATSPIFWSSDLPPGHVPQPPPRRKYSMKGKENRGTKYEESIRQIYEEKETTVSISCVLFYNNLGVAYGSAIKYKVFFFFLNLNY